MKLHIKTSPEKLRRAKERSLKVAKATGKGALSTADDALFYQKQKLTSKEETETAGEAMNTATNIIFSAKNRRLRAGRRVVKIQKKTAMQDKNIFRKHGQIKSLNNKKAVNALTKAEIKRALLAKKEEKAVFRSKKIITKGDIAKGTGTAVIGAVASEVGKNDEETRNAIKKARQISRIPGKTKQAKKAVTNTYKGGKFLTQIGLKTATAVANAIKAITAIMGPFFIIICSVVLALSIILIIVSGGMEEEENADNSLCPYGNMYYWIRWETGTWDADEAFSMTLGDNGRAYGMQFDYKYALTPFNKACYESDKERYKAFAPYTAAGSVKLNDKQFAAVWKKIYANNKEDFAEKQKTYAKNQYYAPVAAHLKANGVKLDKYNDVVKGAVLSYSWQHGSGEAKGTVAGIIKKGMSDEEVITSLYQKREAMHPAFKTRYKEEKDYAISLLNAGSIGLGGVAGSNVVGTAQQKRIVQYATSGSNFGVGQGWCQAWVANVYKAATGVRNSKCCARACRDAWATKKGDIPVGAAIYCGDRYRSRTNCSCGRNAGHVGIYIGNGRVVSMLGRPTIQTLQSWNSYYGYGGWSWNGGKAAN